MYYSVRFSWHTGTRKKIRLIRLIRLTIRVTEKSSLPAERDDEAVDQHTDPAETQLLDTALETIGVSHAQDHIVRLRIIFLDLAPTPQGARFVSVYV